MRGTADAGHRGARWRAPVALLFAVALLAGACGGNKSGTSTKANSGASTNFTTEPPSDKKPVYGGSVTYGIEADPGGSLCLPEGQLAIAGILTARMFYDTLTVPNSEGTVSPWLAQAVTHDDTYKTWTIKLRDGVVFSDGSKLDATVVKNNLDAYRGSYPARSPLLFRYVFSNVDTVTATDPLTVTVTTKVPWVDFDAFLWGSGRIGIMGQKQLDSKDCGTDVVGTGPYLYKEYIQGDHVTGTKNPNYWYKDPANNNKLPYLDSLTLKVVTEAAQRNNGLDSGDLDIMHTSDGSGILQLRSEAKAGKVNLLESDKFGEVSYALMNSASPPFDNLNARLAVAYGTDRQALIDKSQQGVNKIADGPFTKGNVGYLDDPGFPKYDIAKAKEYLAKYKAETGKDLEITISHTPDTGTTDLAKLVQEQAQAVGITVNLQPFEQAQLITNAVKGTFQVMLWRNHPGGDPDTQYVWWHSGSLVNFGHINDPQIDSLLDEGRSEPDPAKRQAIYENLNRRFASQVYNIWTWATLWDIGSSTKVHGIFGPKLPDGKSPTDGLATGHFLGALWKEK